MSEQKCENEFRFGPKRDPNRTGSLTGRCGFSSKNIESGHANRNSEISRAKVGL